MQCRIGQKHRKRTVKHNNLRLNFILWYPKIHFPHGGSQTANPNKKTSKQKKVFLKTNLEVALPAALSLSSSGSRKRRRSHSSQHDGHVAIVHPSRPHMRQKRSRGSVQFTQLWPNLPQFKHPGRLLPACARAGIPFARSVLAAATLRTLAVGVRVR